MLLGPMHGSTYVAPSGGSALGYGPLKGGLPVRAPGTVGALRVSLGVVATGTKMCILNSMTDPTQAGCPFCGNPATHTYTTNARSGKTMYACSDCINDTALLSSPRMLKERRTKGIVFQTIGAAIEREESN